ncbi:VCBS repeat-containing protein [uncultured Zobellia sp.]|uniref:FG-GAP repeat domain-containing protein n=1 Tax=uncultured Zobellia sp. TaxID=255433 RepID=UPI0025968547|nr:VCBS repeat-containing protein [uncultured Zobellia sp.]
MYFTANRTSNKLYLNQGGFRLKDITEQAGVGGKQAWSTGVGFADVNNDGFLDIYVCNSGDVQGDNKANELFINNGTTGSIDEVRFTESADMYGVADKGYSTHSAFFDYDNDGDLDLYLLNNSSTPIVDFIKHGYKNTRNERDALGGDKMLRNDDGVFRVVTEEAGIFGSQIGFGLGVSVGDINKDGWLDIYVSNDFLKEICSM